VRDFRPGPVACAALRDGGEDAVSAERSGSAELGQCAGDGGADV